MPPLFKLDKLFVLFSISSFFCLVACHSGKDSSFNRAVRVKAAKIDKIRMPLTFPWSDLDQVQIQDQFNQFECENCPFSFGHLLVKKKVIESNADSIEVTGHCQGSLIDEDLFLTARHCLPESIEEPGDSCEDNMKVILPRVSADKPLEVLDCDEVMDVSKTYEGIGDNNAQPDWAILKLKNKSERFLKPEENSPRGISDNESLFGFLPLRDPETHGVSIAQLECKAIQGSLTLPEFSQNKGPLALLKCNFPAVYGFSGMTLFRLENGKYFPVGTLSHIVETRNLKVNRLQISFSKKIVISQIICMTNNNVPEFCQFDPKKRKEHEQALYKKSLERSKVKIDKELEKWIVDENNPIQWRTVNSKNWKNLPQPYLAYFNRNLERFRKSFGRTGEVGVSYLQNLIPVYPECVRREFIPNQNQQISAQIPVTQVSLSRVEEKKITTYYKVTPVEARLVPGNNAVGLSVANMADRRFFIKLSSGKPKIEFPGQSIVSQGFFHLSAEVPICP